MDKRSQVYGAVFELPGATATENQFCKHNRPEGDCLPCAANERMKLEETDVDDCIVANEQEDS
jgi:hypothetical protein